MLGEVDHKTQILDGVLVNRPLRVVDEAAGSEDGKGENFGIVGGVFIEGSNAFGVDDQNVDWFSIGGSAFDGSTPAPETLSAGIDCGPNSKSIAAVE